MSDQGVGKKPREFYFEYIEETNEYQQLSNKAPYVRDHSFELIHVVEYSRVEQLEKENAEFQEALKTANNYIGSLRVHGYATHIKMFEELWAEVESKFKLGGGGNV